MFHFCIADSEHDWREGTEQYKFIEKCLASVDRQKQPWLIFSAHRVLGYSSNSWYGLEGAFEEPMGRESLQKLWQKYRVDIAFFGHVHNYERTCPVYQVCTIAVHVWFDPLQRIGYRCHLWHAICKGFVLFFLRVADDNCIYLILSLIYGEMLNHQL